MVMLCRHVTKPPPPRGKRLSCHDRLLTRLHRRLLFLIFFPRATPSTTNPARDPEAPSWRTALFVAATSVVHAIVIFILSMYFILARPNHLQGWANFLGIFSTVLASIQYLPQIYTTFMLKRVGSLSIPMMCIQTPGSFVWAASLAARLGKEGWSAWGVYVVTGCLQGTLLVMGVYFEWQAMKREKALGGGDEGSGGANGAASQADGPSEQTPLLRPPD